jgi:hypothetical protein
MKGMSAKQYAIWERNISPSTRFPSTLAIRDGIVGVAEANMPSRMHYSIVMAKE